MTKEFKFKVGQLLLGAEGKNFYVLGCITKKTINVNGKTVYRILWSSDEESYGTYHEDNVEAMVNLLDVRMDYL